MKATRDEQTFTLTGQHWSGTYPIEDLPRWLTFYRQQRDLHPKSGHAYDETNLSLETLSSEPATRAG